MKFKDFLSEKTENRKVVVVYGGGFQPFHAGHMSSYEQAKRAFPTADFYVASSNDVKTRPIPFADKRFLAQQAGVVDPFVQVVQPVNPHEILSKYNPDKDILVLVRSERDPVSYTKKDGSPAYYQPFKSIKESKPFNPKGGHGYIFVTKKKVFKIGQKEVYSGSQVREMYQKADDAGRRTIIKSLYPKATNPEKVKRLLDKYIGGGLKESLDENFEDFFEYLTEGVHDKGIFKAVFLGGGPGSGKDYVLDKTLTGHGLTEINSDKALEFLMDKNNLDMRMPENEREARDLVRSKAKTMTELKQKLALLGRNGLIINGTGDDVQKIKKIKDRLEELGYETSMLMVNTADEVSKQRNIERGQRGGRTVPEEIRKEKWDSVQKSRAEHAKMFGDRYMEFDNSEDLRTAAPEVVKSKTKELQDIYKNVSKFVSKPSKNDVSKQWIASELQKKDTAPIDKKKEITPHEGSKAAEQAREMGLQYYGFGRYGKNGKVTHRSVHDSLVAVEKLPTPNVDMPVPGTSMKKVNEEVEQLFNESYDLSDAGALNLLLLGDKISEEGLNSDADMHQFTNEETKRKNFLKDSKGKIRVFMLRRAAAREAHQKNGTVYPHKNGYIVQLHEENKNGYSNISKGIIFNEGFGSKQRTTLSEARTVSTGTNAGNTSTCTSCGRTESGITESRTSIGENYCCSACEAEANKKTKITIDQIRQRKKDKEIKESIDKGTEPGVSMAGSGESIGRDMGEKIRKKDGKVTVVNELTGDETTISIGDKKEDELKKVGINLQTFKAKRTI